MYEQLTTTNNVFSFQHTGENSGQYYVSYCAI